MGNWTFDMDDDFTLPNGDWQKPETNRLDVVHKFAEKCKLLGYSIPNPYTYP